MKTSLRYTQLESGLSKSFFCHNFYKAHFLVTPTWITNLWQYCSECHVQLQETESWTYSAPRRNDFFLMDVVLRSSISQEHKEIFNRVRLNLRLLTASDIVLADKSTKFIPSIQMVQINVPVLCIGLL